MSHFFRLQGIKIYWPLQFLGYLRTLSSKFQKARTKIEVVLTLPCWLSQFSWDSQQGRARTTSILVWAFWNCKLKVLKYSRNCISQYILVAEVWHSLTYIVHTAMYKRGFNLLLLFVLFPWDIHISWRTTAPTKSPQGCVVIRRKLVELDGG